MKKPKQRLPEISDRVRLRGRGAPEGWVIWINELSWAWVWWDAWETYPDGLAALPSGGPKICGLAELEVIDAW